MPSNELAPYRRAQLDQWNAFLDEVVGCTVEHLARGNCSYEPGMCIGTDASATIEALPPIQVAMLLEVAIVRLAELRTSRFVYQPRFHCWVPNREGEDPDDHEHDSSITCDWGWICNADGCSVRTDDLPCPEHAPTEVRGLRLVECAAEPRHWIWVHRNDDYGHGCPECYYHQKDAELAPLLHAARRRGHRWCWLTNRAKRALIWLRLMRYTGGSNEYGYCWHTFAKWRWSR